MDDKKQQRIAELSNVDAYFGEEKDFKKELAYIGGSAVGLIAAAVGAVFVKNNSYKYTLIIAAFFLAFMIADIARLVIREKQVLKIIKAGERDIKAIMEKSKCPSLYSMLGVLYMLISNKHLAGIKVTGGERLEDVSEQEQNAAPDDVAPRSVSEEDVQKDETRGPAETDGDAQIRTEDTPADEVNRTDD